MNTFIIRGIVCDVECGSYYENVVVIKSSVTPVIDGEWAVCGDVSVHHGMKHPDITCEG